MVCYVIVDRGVVVGAYGSFVAMQRFESLRFTAEQFKEIERQFEYPWRRCVEFVNGVNVYKTSLEKSSGWGEEE